MYAEHLNFSCLYKHNNTVWYYDLGPFYIYLFYDPSGDQKSKYNRNMYLYGM